MQFKFNSIHISIVLGLLSSVLSEDAKINNLECVKSVDANTDYFPQRIKVNDASLFSVDYTKAYKKIMNKSTNETIVLYQCGTNQPKIDGVKKYFKVPVENVTAKDTSTIAFLSALGVLDKVKAVDTTASISNPCIQKGLDDKSIEALSTTNKTLAQIQLNKTQVHFSSFEDSSSPDEQAVIASAVMDPSLKARAEWLEYYSLFFNLEDKAQKITNDINNNYDCLVNKAKALSEKNKVKVAWIAYVAGYNGTKASFTLSKAPFKKNLISDAGAELITDEKDSFEDADSLIKIIKDADVIVDETFNVDNIDDFLKAFKLKSDSDVKAIKNKMVIRLDGIGSPNNGYDWFESAVLMADAVLQDFIRAIYPKGSLKDVNEHLWFRNIANSESKIEITAADCKNNEWKNLANDCATGKQADIPKEKGSGSKSNAIALSSTILIASVAVLIPFIL